MFFTALVSHALFPFQYFGYWKIHIARPRLWPVDNPLPRNSLHSRTFPCMQTQIPFAFEIFGVNSKCLACHQSGSLQQTAHLSLYLSAWYAALIFRDQLSFKNSSSSRLMFRLHTPWFPFQRQIHPSLSFAVSFALHLESPKLSNTYLVAYIYICIFYSIWIAPQIVQFISISCLKVNARRSMHLQTRTGQSLRGKTVRHRLRDRYPLRPWSWEQHETHLCIDASALWR